MFTRVLDFNFQGIVTKTSTQLKTVEVGGIAIVSGNEDIPQMISFNDMINLKGIADAGIAKFFIGSDFKEFASIGISEIPNQIKVAV
ncbi:MAG: hypothetical protein EZS28_034329 [Streblomastix strix]|uniref:Uncharacterized protein n=1 Tax=Streblomastix strix TaxID=222440 RepID=A0A5J4UKA6_9EUKA|nr:MAG: hypothetical protein EZS28_034329 [Streblomastix strix]